MPEHPFERFVQALRAHGCLRARGCFVREGRARALCPVHGDTRPSLSITMKADTLLLNCFFCGPDGKSAILRALGLKPADFYSGPPLCPAPRYVVAEYDYGGGSQKVRYNDKSFAWRRRDPAAPGGWVGMRGTVGLYRLHDLPRSPITYLTEGEKTVDYLRSLGLPVTCGPDGAGRWRPEWSLTLWQHGCRALVVLVDHDAAGTRHGALVARVTYGLDVPEAEAIEIRVVDLPGLAAHEDAYDWLHRHPVDALWPVIAETPVWTPDGAAQAKLASKRACRARRNRSLRRRKADERARLRAEIRDAANVSADTDWSRDAANVTGVKVTEEATRDAANVQSRDAPEPRRSASSDVTTSPSNDLGGRDASERTPSTWQGDSTERGNEGPPYPSVRQPFDRDPSSSSVHAPSGEPVVPSPRVARFIQRMAGERAPLSDHKET